MNIARHDPARGLGRWSSLLSLSLPLLALAPPAWSQAPPAVRLTAGLLSVQAADVRLVDLLDEVARRAGFVVVACPACEQRVSQRFDRVPLAQGLTMILRDQPYALAWRADRAGRLAPQRLWILPQPGRPPSARAATLALGTPDDREQAAAAIGRMRAPRATAVLARALTDSDPHVRRAVVESLAEIGGADAVAALALALRDTEPRLREAAVNALGELGGPAAIALLRQAERDATAFVRQAAADALEALQRAAR